MVGHGKDAGVVTDPHTTYSSTDYYDGNEARVSPDIDAYDSSTMDPSSGVKRGLKNRHLSMMALAGIIGPGLLVGAGGALSHGGPASLLIGFGVIGMFYVAGNDSVSHSFAWSAFKRLY